MKLLIPISPELFVTISCWFAQHTILENINFGLISLYSPAMFLQPGGAANVKVVSLSGLHLRWFSFIFKSIEQQQKCLSYFSDAYFNIMIFDVMQKMNLFCFFLYELKSFNITVGAVQHV